MSLHYSIYQVNWQSLIAYLVTGNGINPVTNNYEGIARLTIDYENVSQNPEMKEVLDKIIETRKEYYPQIIENSLTVWKSHHNYTKDDINSFVTSMINKPVIYNDLYYTYLLSHELNKQNIYKEASFAEYIIPPFGDLIDFECNQAYNAAYQELCKSWCNIKIHAEDPYILEYGCDTWIKYELCDYA